MSYQALLFCPDDKTARVVTQVLTELDFTVEPCNEPFAAVKKLMAQHFDAIVVDCDNEQNASLLFKSARNSSTNQSSLSVAVVEGQAGVAKAFRIGANLVLTKPINVEQSKGTLRVARGLLRKADSAKPAGSAPERPLTPAVTLPSSARPFAPSAPELKTSAPAPFAQQKAPSVTAVPMATRSGFEVESDPGPALDSTEAALLESMPDTVSPVGQNRQPGSSPKEYPWQPVAKPLSEPMASALRRAEEAANKPSVSLPPAASEDSPSLSSEPASPSQGGAAAATAPAKEKELARPSFKPFPAVPVAAAAASGPVEGAEIASLLEPVAAKLAAIPATAPAIEPPTFSAYAIKDHEEAAEEGSGRGKLFLVVAAAVILAAAYMGWTKMHSGSAPSSIQNQAAPATSQSSATGTNAQPGDAAIGQGTPSEIVEAPAQPGQHATPSLGAKPSPAMKNAPSVPSPLTKEAEVAQEQPEPIVVKKDFSTPRNPATAAAEVPQPAAPGVLGIAANADDKAISGIVSNPPVSTPKPIPQQTLRVSQGVSQGLLANRVQPVYPPQALQMRLQGAVQLQAVIGKDGSITNLKALSGDAVLSRAAMDAVRQWKYKPYYLNGEPIEIQTIITVNFKLP